MENNRNPYIHVSHLWIALILALLTSVPLQGQTTQEQTTPQMGPRTTMPPAPPRDVTPPVSPRETSPPIDNDTTNRELRSMDRFLDSHPEVSEQLRKDPSLIDNKQFVENHPALQQYLQEHPQVREEFRENPNAFMRQEERYDRREDRRGDRDITRGELASMDRFMDGHPEISEQLRKDPSLIDNKPFVENHPALQQYLQEHPQVREEARENPNAFMHREERYDRREDSRGDRDITRGELGSTDHFMDSHPEIAEQLRKDPSLINDKKFVDSHPALQEYLQNHPQVREEFKENPNAYMRQENRYDRHEDSATFRDRDRDLRGGEMSSFGDFLRGHSNVADQLSKDPTLANNKEFLATHPELQNYLKSHPEMQQQLATNPHAVMTSPHVTTTPTPGKSLTPDPKPKQ